MSEDMTSSLEEVQAQFQATRYEPIRQLHRSPSATSWLAHDKRVGRLVVIKHWHPESYVSLAAFEQEANILRRLSHPGIVALFDSNLDLEPPGPYHVLDYIVGHPANLFSEQHRIPTNDLIRFGISVCDALSHLHSLDILHGDIKPDNVIWDGFRATLVDFGCARHTDHPVPQLDLLNDRGSDDYQKKVWVPTGQALGTTPFLAPEIIWEQSVDTRADLFALGVTLFWLAVGYRPFTGTTDEDIAKSIVRDPPTVLSSGNPELDKMILSLLAKNRDDRYQTAAALKLDLEPLIQPYA